MLEGKKTYIVAGLMALIGVVNVISGEATLGNLLASPDVRLVFEALGLGALRAGVAKRL